MDKSAGVDAPATHRRGLSTAEAAARLAQVGPNSISQAEPPSPVRLFLAQLKGPLILLLFAAAGIAAALGEVIDAVAIISIVVLNAGVGFAQEYRAERALLALRALTAPRARVVRDGHKAVIAAAEVVPGDLLALEAGDIVAADAIVREAASLATIEAALTGESLPSEKGTEPSAEGAAMADRTDTVFAGTSVASGTGLAEVFATGMKTEVGRVAQLLARAERGATPLQERLEAVSRSLLWICLGVVCLVAVLGLARGQAPLEVLLASVSLAVAAVPEGLPAVVTIALAVGVQRLSARHVLVRRLHAVETLGSTTVICTDKTGTLTTGQMAVRGGWAPDLLALYAAAASCCDAELAEDGHGGVGDTTELAILSEAARLGVLREPIEQANPRVADFPFDSVRKRMGVLRADGRLYVKGAPEHVLPLCANLPDEAQTAAHALAHQGLRVLAVAVGEGAEERDLALLGFIGLADPPRAEARDAVADARGAGIRVVMITGDHPVTAAAIARELGVLGVAESPDGVVHARVTPENKLDIVRSWKEQGAVVAMTGDGVNDAPAIRESHIGIAMGRGGTEVAREAADIILTDDNFASIVAGIREGRAIYDNIRKTLLYLLAGNTAELMIMLGASLAGLPIPFVPIQLLWINLLTDGLPALALVVDPPDRDTLLRPPRPPDEQMLGRRQWSFVAISGLLEAAVVLGAFAWAFQAEGIEAARSLGFSTLVCSELLRSFAARSPNRVLWEVGAFSNPALVGVVAVSLLLQVGLSELAFTRELFHLQPFDLGRAALAFGLALIPATGLEVLKLVRRALVVRP